MPFKISVYKFANYQFCLKTIKFLLHRHLLRNIIVQIQLISAEKYFNNQENVLRSLSREMQQQCKKMDVLRDILGFLRYFHPEPYCIPTEKTFCNDESLQIYRKLLIFTKKQIRIYTDC